MKDRFKWYTSPTEDELGIIWSTGILTVDANVLLDIYRYHEKTRREIVRAIDAFENRVWLSDQASKEFIKNRKTVISASERTFGDAQVALGNLNKGAETAIATLKSYRLVPPDSLDGMRRAVSDAVSQAESQILDAKSRHPDYLKEDPILEWVLTKFDGHLGDEPTLAEMEMLLKEAEDRQKRLIPPGYLDSEKDGDGPFGDFLLWRQTLLYAKSVEKPVILVTSERKEDWWEKISGKTVGPRMELMQESERLSGQRVLIFHTERFIQMASERIGARVDQAAVEEIRHVSVQRAVPLESAISVTHLNGFENNASAEGRFEVDVLFPVRNFSCTTYLNPQNKNLVDGEVRVELAKSPLSVPNTMVRAALGEANDLNVHVQSLDWEQSLPIGKYLFNYSVNANVSSSQSILAEQHRCVQCGRSDAWNGVRCMFCGFVDCD